MKFMLPVSLLLLLLEVQAASAQKSVTERSLPMMHEHPFHSFSFIGSQFRFLWYEYEAKAYFCILQGIKACCF